MNDGTTRLTGAIVNGYTLSGWRRDKHGHYRVWESVLGTMSAASLKWQTLAVPKPPTGRQRPSFERARLKGGTVPEMKLVADWWLMTTIAKIGSRAPAPGEPAQDLTAMPAPPTGGAR